MRITAHACGCALALALLSALGRGAFAAPDEVQVYTEELNDPGKYGLELHLNYALEGAKEASFAGEMQSHHRLQATPELSYGLGKTLEAGLYLPAAMSSDGNLYGNGLRLRLKYIAPRAEDARIFWGLNGELGQAARRVSDSRLGFELRPIIGYRSADWLLSFNPILGMDLSPGFSREPKFEPALKVARKTAAGVHAGLEYYGEYGPLHHLLPADERAHYLYASVDLEVKGYDINFGIGRGVKAAGDQWVAKAIVSFPFK